MSYVRLVLSGSYHETGIQTRGLSSAARNAGFRFDVFFLKVEALKRKKDVKKVLIECRQDFSALAAGLEEIRERIEALKACGKEVYFYSSSYSGPQLYLAAACSYRLIHPMGTVRFFGLSQSFLFARRIMRRFGIDSEIIRRGGYKSAGDRFRTDKLEEPNREQYEHFMSTVMDSLREGIKSGFDKNNDDIEQLIGGRVLTADAAADASWIDEIVTAGEFLERWKTQGDKEFKFRKTPEKAGHGFSFVSRQIAVLVFEGAIVDGHSRRDPVMGQAVGAVSFIPRIRELRDDRKVKAVVFRINSGGGSAFASEEITAELRLLAGKKPLIVSMSEIAGSGGYWISCCGRKTFALPTTLTGSIGVISIYLAWHRLLENIGLTHDTIRKGEYADTGSPLRAMTDRERNIIELEIENMYRGFVDMVAGFRKISPDDVDAAAQGRVWPGSSARDYKLVDEMGGLSDAVRAAAEEAGISRPVVRFYPEVKHGLIERLIMNISKEDDESLETIAALSGLSRLAEGALKSCGPMALTEEELFRWI